jgi:tetratricopeptide (TPR) repeat protein
MPDVAKLKKKAAELELKKQFDKALAVYVEILDSFEGSNEEVDVALYNRVGDIHLKQGNVADAVDYYEKAVDHYVETGFYNNAIALCNKILRSSPGRASIYYKLGKVSAHKGFKSDAKANYLEYADRMQKSGKLNEAFRALKEFADLCPDQDDIRLMLADQLTKAKRGEEAVEQLQLLYERYVQEGHHDEAEATVQRMKQIDPKAAPRQPGTAKRHNSGDLVFLDLNDGQPAPPPRSAMHRATAGLDIIDPGTSPAGPPPRPAAAPPSRPAAAPPQRPAAPAPPAARAAEPPAEPPGLLDSADFQSAALEGITRQVEFEHLDEPPTAGLLDGLQSAGLDDDTSLIGSGSLLDIEPTGLGGPPAAPPTSSSLDESLLDFDTFAGNEAPPSRPASKAPQPQPPKPQPPKPQPPKAAPPRTPQPSLADLPMLEDMPGTGDLEIMMPEDLSSVTGRGGSAGNAGAVDDLPLMDLDLPGESKPASPRAISSDLDMLDLTPADEAGARSEEVPLTARRSSTIIAVQSVEMLQNMADSEPEDHGLRRRLAEAMLESGDREGGLRELEAAMVGYERVDDLDAASSIADEIVLLIPDSVRHLQKRVEYAFRQNERGRLIEAYLELADALFRAGTVDKSRAIYQRVLDLAPDDLRAQAALESMPVPEAVPPPPPPPPKGRTSAPQTKPKAPPPKPAPSAPATSEDEFVNLGDWLRSEASPKDTRMVVEEQEPTGDEEADFADMLRKFKQGIAENIEEEDHQSHYDLGVAYKEMGLLDEAISEFQKALRAPTNRVPAYEALGASFIEKEQYPMAATILTRALNEKGVNDDQLVGVLYLLGRCAEERGTYDVALEYYQRVFVVDIQFRDVGDRLAALEGASS